MAVRRDGARRDGVKRVRRAKPERRYTLPRGSGTERAAPRPKPSRPAPKRQPGPSSDRERRKVRRYEKSPEAKRDRKEAREGRGDAKQAAEVRKALRTRRLRSTEELREALPSRDPDKVRPLFRVKDVERVGGDDKSLDKLLAEGFDSQNVKFKKGSPSDKRQREFEDTSRREYVRKVRERRAESLREVTAPAVKVLEQTLRPVHAVAGGTRAAIRGENIPKAAGRGIALKDKYLFSDVLKEAGVPEGVRGPAGFVLDVALDPTTYVTGGASVPAKAAARKAQQQTYKQAVKRGASPKKARKVASKAARKAYAEAPKNKGVQLRVAGRSTSGTTTARLSRATGASKAATRVRETRAVQGVARDVAPRFRPKGVTGEQHEALRGAVRESRARATRGRFYAVQQAQALKKAIPSEEYSRVVAAIERGTVYDLPEKLRIPARQVEQAFSRARKQERKAGIDVPARRQYFAHVLDDTVGGVKNVRKAGRRVINPDYAKGRKHHGSVKAIAEREGIQFSEDVPRVVADRLARSSRDVAEARLNRALLDAGRRWKPGQKVELDEGEAIFQVVGSDIRKISDKDAARLKDGDGFVILNERVVDEARDRVVPGASRSTLGRGYDKAQGAFKFTATVPNPGFHVRNLVGDLQNAYLVENPARLARNVGRSARALKRLGAKEEAVRKGKRVKPTTATVTVKDEFGQKQKITYDQLVKEAEQHGAIRAGFIGQELPELLRDTGAVRGVGRSTGRRLGRVIQSREDLVRLATYIGGRQRGLSPREATERTMGQHFDYGDLTSFERTVLRRLVPFYTFTARNIPLQAKTLVTRPGKYANFEKARQETARAMGFSQEWEKDLREYQQRGVPIPVKWGGQQFAISPALPLMDLNQIAIPGLTTKSFLASLDEQAKKAGSVLSPLIKSPIELYANYHFFFRGDIEREDSPLVAAPGWVGSMPASWRKRFGIVPDYLDKRTGKRTWGWPAKVDYVAELPPGPFHFFSQISTSGTNRRGQGAAEKVASYLTGFKPDPVDRVETLLELAYREKKKFEKRRSALAQRGQGAKDDPNTLKRHTGEYEKVKNRIARLDEYIAKLREQRGDVVISNRARKVKPASRFQQPQGNRFLEQGNNRFLQPQGNRFTR